MFEGIEFNQDSQDNPVKVLLELLNPDNVDMKTDVNINQIRCLCEVSYFTKRLQNPDEDPITQFQDVFHEFKVLMCSKGRMSRRESIEGVKEVHPMEQQENIIGPMGKK